MTDQEIRDRKPDGKNGDLSFLNEVKFHKSRKRYQKIKNGSKFKNVKLKPL